ncbi:MAG: carboxypeptidase-like regulatory domain-containing protein [Muribaculaceae bacterium]|nr:carboxypeptidase-like regulatory domain-containing protein [Muribaculaceae bacterium]
MTKRIHTFLLSVLAVMACALYPAAAFAQNNLTLTGKVTDADNGEPLEFVIVQLPERNLWAETDEKGIFSIKNLRPGTYTVFIQSTGYQDYTHTIDLSAKAEPLLISLHPSSLALKEVTVTASTKRMGSIPR